MRKIAFIIPPTVEILDLAGPVQVFTEARFNGYELALEYYSYKEEIISTSGLAFNNIRNYREAGLGEGDFVFMPGMDNKYVSSISFKAEKEFSELRLVASRFLFITIFLSSECLSGAYCRRDKIRRFISL